MKTKCRFPDFQDNVNLITWLLGFGNVCIDGIGRKKTTEISVKQPFCGIASFLKKMKPETARKHFTDPFRYWHPVTNNNVQKLVLLVALLVESLFLAKVHRGVFFSNATVKY